MNFSKVRLLILLLGVSFLSACGQKTKVFSGESYNWSVHYEFTQEGESVESSGYIKYIGPKPTPNHIEYSFDHESQSGIGRLSKDGVFYMLKDRCISSNCSLPNEDSEFEALIKWNDQSESITLTVE